MTELDPYSHDDLLILEGTALVIRREGYNTRANVIDRAAAELRHLHYEVIPGQRRYIRALEDALARAHDEPPARLVTDLDTRGRT